MAKTVLTSDSSGPSARGIPRALVGLLRWGIIVAEAAGRWRREEAAARALSALDDRTLRDIGIRRDDIRSVAAAVAEGRYHRPPGFEVPQAWRRGLKAAEVKGPRRSALTPHAPR